MATITEQVGRVLGGRYRLEAGVGTGTSAFVFAATDLVLLRRVAVKVLQPGLGADEAFLRRFRAEAQAAAALEHPNVLKVYDWGQDPDGAYLVLELVAGGSLRDLLDAGVRLDHAQAARLGAEAAHGLAYAHRRGLVHRDVKPANLMLDEDGHVHIADFGLARALAEAAWTEPLGAVLGTARYASPEQAEGRPLDDRSDVYSLALVLYEALVGRVPFSGDTTLSTLMARVGATLPRAPELGPLAPVLAQAAIAEPLARLDAAELAVELELIRRTLPPPAPLPVRGGPARGEPPGARPPSLDERESVRALWAASRELKDEQPASGRPAPGAPKNAAAADASRRPGASDMTSPSGAAAAATFAVPAVPTAPAAPGAGELPAPRSDRRALAVAPARRRRRRRRLVAGGLVVLAAALAAGGTVAYQRFVRSSRAVPALAGDRLDAARAAASERGLGVRLGGALWSSQVPAGAVVSQTPRPGSHVRAGTVIVVHLSRGRAPVALPAGLVGERGRTAAGRLRADHFSLRVTTVYDAGVGAGRVARVVPASGALPYGARVDLVVSRGPAPVTIPPIPAGAGWVATQRSLQSLHLRTVEQLAWSSAYAAGEVLSVSPPPGTAHVRAGTPVTVVVSRGPAPVTIPAVPAGAGWAQYGDALVALGLKPVEQLQYSDSVPAGEIVSVSPGPGSPAVAPGTTVEVTVSRGPVLVAVPAVDGDSIAAAVAAIEAQGLTVSEQIGPPLATKATTTSPAPGTDVREGTSVVLYVA
jgi:serine/threonine-protein kinase